MSDICEGKSIILILPVSKQLLTDSINKRYHKNGKVTCTYEYKQYKNNSYKYLTQQKGFLLYLGSDENHHLSQTKETLMVLSVLKWDILIFRARFCVYLNHFIKKCF